MVRGSDAKKHMRTIPGTDGYQATEDGRIFDPLGNERKRYKNGDGYVTASVKVNGEIITFGVHRLVALAYLPLVEGKDQVNHIDGNIENNSVGNLEWVTVKENNLHAAFMAGSPSKPTLILISPDGEPSYALNKEAAMERIKCSIVELWTAIKNDTLIDGWVVKMNTNAKLPKGLTHYKTNGLKMTDSITVIDTETNILRRYKTVREFSELTGIQQNLIQQTLSSRDRFRLCMRRYVIARTAFDMPRYTEEDVKRIQERKNKSVISLDIKTRKPTIHSSAVEFYRKYGLSKKAVTTSLRKDTIKELNGMIFLYLNDKNAKRIKSYCPQSSADND